MKKILLLIFTFALLMLLTACSSAKGNAGGSNETNVNKITDYPKIEEIVWEFRNTVRYGEPVAAFDYTNNSNFTIVQLYFEFKMKDGVTSEQLQLIDALTGTLVPDEEISKVKPYVIDWIVCDPGEKAEGAAIYMKYNTEPSNTNQCELMELKSADICFIAEDGKLHTVSYSPENSGYSLHETAEELFTWIDNDFTKMIPKPNTRIASAKQNDETSLVVKAYDIAHEAYMLYVDSCEKIGFTNMYPNDDHDYSYFGINQQGYKIHIRYIDYMQHIEITLEKNG